MSNKKKEILVYFVTLVMSIVLILGGRTLALTGDGRTQYDDQYQICRARVVSVEPAAAHPEVFDGNIYAEGAVLEVFFTAEVTAGEHKGETIHAVQVMEEYYSTGRKYVEEGDKVLLIEVLDMYGNPQWNWQEYIRTDALLILGAVLCLGMIVFGRMKGINTLVTFAFTCLAIFYVFLPAISAGKNPYIWSLLTCLYICTIALLFVNGASQKSLVAGISCFAGILASAALMLLMERLLHMTGVHNDESIYLMLLNPTNPVDLKGLVFAGVIIGASGALMDLSMSITSPLFEMYEQTGGMSAGELIKSGIHIGRDYLSTMSNTLVLAYIGCDLSLVLLLMAYNTSALEVMNREMLIAEILQALLGIFGILLTVPISSFFCAVTLCGKKRVPVLPETDDDLPRPMKLQNLSNYDLSFPADRHGLDSRPRQRR
ncbi:MAG: YibE/F family protein [Clostridia bacterium]|nr:YibE/F family protein [Clostridia bacterium]